MLSVLSSIGLLCFLGVKSTLIIIEVIPFLVLAVGVDNIFIFVQHFNRIKLDNSESSRLTYDEVLQVRMRRLLTFVSPSVLMAAFAECSCFFIGCLTPMPAVQIFALNAGIALLLSLLFQMLIFIPILALDARRQDSNRFEIFCCISSKKSQESEDEVKQSYLYLFFSNVFAPFLMKPIVRLVVVSSLQYTFTVQH